MSIEIAGLFLENMNSMIENRWPDGNYFWSGAFPGEEGRSLKGTKRCPCKSDGILVGTTMSKIGRNHPCPCSSGRKYKDCCLQQSQKAKLPFGAILDGMRKASLIETCMHPEASKQTCGKIIKAHTLQRSRVLNALCDSSRRVMTFQTSTEAKFVVREIGWKDASTFKAFCDKHDGPTFEPLEQKPFTGTDEQIFLTAYRAFCWETYQKARALKGAQNLRTNLRQGTEPWAWSLIEQYLSVQDAGYQKGLDELRRIKPSFDGDLIAHEYSRYSHAEFVLSGTPFIAAVGAITPNYSLTGKPLQKLVRESNIEWLSFGIDVSDQGSHFTFCWDRNNSAPALYMEEVLKLSPSDLAAYLCQFCFMHCENTYFSKQWWQALSSSHQDLVTRLMSNGNPYAESPAYKLDVVLAPWKLSSLKTS